MALNKLEQSALEFAQTLQEAEWGDAASQFKVGLMYANGAGTTQNFKKAMHWYRMASDQGYSPAQCLLAGKYAGGHGVPQDFEKALGLYVRAAEKGNSKALLKLGQFMEKPPPAAVENLFRKAAAKGSPEAQVALGNALMAGMDGPEKTEQAFDCYRKAATQGDAEAQYRLALLYGDHNSPDHDPAQALAWQHKAAAQGHALGRMIVTGQSRRLLVALQGVVRTRLQSGRLGP